MPKKDLRALIQELQAQGDHAAIVSLCTRTLVRRDRLSRDDRIFFLRQQAIHLAAINPEFWQRQITSALADALVEAAGAPDTEAQILKSLSAADVPLRIPLEIEATVRRFEALSDRHPEVRVYGKDIYFNLGYTYEMARDFARAEASYQRSLDICRDVSALEEAGQALHNLAHVYVKTNRLAEAKVAASEAHQLIPWEYGTGKMLCLKGKIAHLEGDLDAARALFGEALNHPSATKRTEIDILAAWAELELHAGNNTRAREFVDRALLLAYQLPYAVAVDELNDLAERIGGEE